MEISDYITEFRRPFTPDAVKYKIQTAKGSNALVVKYIDARHVTERLNIICPGEWSDHYKIIETHNGVWGVQCTISLGEGINGITRTDIGTSGDDSPNPNMGGLKILYSDAFKRAGVKLGIAVSLYAAPSDWVPKEHLTVKGSSTFIPDNTTDILRKKYAKWLQTAPAKLFGEPMDHGDVIASQGDIEVE